ncbi:pro-protein convertase [Cryphonectria parasitica EP155]|uniref:Pro-protein convertase n=1 Tax=Cryphonectria parasitica (strain ATCC 38755 / EP155) TaxID=660469 RepID=A0A9P4Y0S4_CRYP1|nr:pro-protein convertase [Cryphonectria parasitica EP155]KAF3764476.1 pro-protein convertase [Cryphonectria parasitica EP155]
MKITALLGLGLAAVAGASDFHHERDDFYIVHLDARTDADEVASRLGLRNEGQFGQLEDHFVLRGAKSEHDVVNTEIKARRRRKREQGGGSSRDVLDGVRFAQRQELRNPWEKRIIPDFAGPRLVEERADPSSNPVLVANQQSLMSTLGISDPIFNEQWHLLNVVQEGHDVNVSGVWLQGITGKNATVAIVDDGLDMHSDDLKDNFYAQGSYDFNDKTDLPEPRLSDDRHGTRCGGEVSAVKNDVCGVGVAYDSNIAGLRILSKMITDADEALAMNYDMLHNDIYSCSWGPPDDGRSMEAPGVLIRRAMLNAVQKGRNGLGNIYVFASGNGAASDDNCNFDGYTNSIYSITVAAVDRKGEHPYYSEACSANLVVTYSSGGGDSIHTTDVGQNTCTSAHGGTSAAAPLAAGIFALVLEIRPDITWRDMQYLALNSAVPINEDDGSWQTTFIGKKFSHTFGYGKIDSYGLVELAKTWEVVNPQSWFFTPWIHVKEAIPQGDEGIAVSFDVTPDMLKEANLKRVEHVTVTMNVDHTRRGDLSVDLVSPNKVISHLSVPRRLDNEASGYIDWTFMSVVHWGESGIGTWTVIVKDTKVNEHNGTWVDWHLKLWGESIDASQVKLLPMPEEDDDADHDAIVTTTIPPSVVTPPAGFHTPGELPSATPTDHPDRPVNAKPTDVTGELDESPQATETASNWLPGFLPTFGVGPRAQAWIYAALALILIFCAGLGVYIFTARRRRLRNATPGGEKTAGAGGKKRTRGGELYDAFAGGSDDEDEEGRFYRDHEEGVEGATSPGGDAAAREKRALGDDDDHHVLGSDSEDEGDEREALAAGRR